MSTDNQHSTSPTSGTKTDTVSWLARPLKYITKVYVTAGDYYMDEVKLALESHIYVLAILSTRDTDLSAYVADVQSASNAYDEALKAEQNIKLLLFRRVPANLPIARIAQTYADTASRAKVIVKTLTQKYGMRAKVLLESDHKATLSLAEVQHAQSLNRLYTSDLEKLADVWTAAERDRLKHLVFRSVLYHFDAHMSYGNKGYEANRSAARYFNNTRMTLRRMMELFPEKEGCIKGSDGGATFGPKDKLSSISWNAYELVTSIPVKDEGPKQGEENKIEPSTNLGSKSASEHAELQLPPAHWLKKLLYRLDRRSGEDVWREAVRISLIHITASRIRATESKEYLASYKVVSTFIDEADKYRHDSSKTLFKHAAHRALSEAKVLNKKYGEVANRISEASVAKYIGIGDTTFRNAWKHLTSDILTRRYEVWSDSTQDEVLEKISNAMRGRTRLVVPDSSIHGIFDRMEAYEYPRLATEALQLLENHCDQCHAGPTTPSHYAEARTAEDSNVQSLTIIISCQRRIRETLLAKIASSTQPFDGLNKPATTTVTNDHCTSRPIYATASKDVRFIHGLLEMSLLSTSGANGHLI